MQIQEEVDQGPREPCAKSLEHGKARARQLGCGFKVKDVEFFSQLPVGQGRKGKDRWLPPALYLHVVGLASPSRNAVVAEVGDSHDYGLQLLFNLGQPGVQIFDLF